MQKKLSHCQQLPSHIRTSHPHLASPHTCCCGIVCRIINARLTRHSCDPCLTAAMRASRHDLAFHLSVQDLSPILPGPIAQDAALVALRQAVLQCISDMARRVGDSLHLLEALGGIVGKLPGPNPLTTAVLECVASAAMAVDYFSPKVCCCCCCWRCLTQIKRAAGSRLMDSFPFASYAFLLQDHTSSNGQVHPHLWPCESANLVYAFV